jgi:aldehyde dehydrogenase (NAD+)
VKSARATARTFATPSRPRTRRPRAWSKSTAHLRAQILYYIGENLDARGDEFAARLRSMTGATAAQAKAEVRPA